MDKSSSEPAPIKRLQDVGDDRHIEALTVALVLLIRCEGADTVCGDTQQVRARRMRRSPPTSRSS